MNGLVSSWKRRLADEVQGRSSLAVLRSVDLSAHVDRTCQILYLYTRPTRGREKISIMAEVVVAIGSALMKAEGIKTNSAVAARIGAFLLYSFEEMGIVRAEKSMVMNGHGVYVVKVLDDDALRSLQPKKEIADVSRMPELSPPPDWMCERNDEDDILVKTSRKAVLEKLSPASLPLVFECVNRAQRVGWRINSRLLATAKWALKGRTGAFSNIWDESDPVSRRSKMRESKTILEMAVCLQRETFYHRYYLDFRGRKYPATSYLHEQGTDLARGLLLRDDAKPIGEAGFFWLCVSIASNWAGDAGRPDGAKTDKIPLKDRAEWVLDHELEILDYGEDPKSNQGWMQADSPWQFLAACMEFYRLRVWQLKKNDLNDFSLSSHLECYIDGSNNGAQHLSALTKDEITAPYVNLVPRPLPGDLYGYVAEHLWEELERRKAAMSDSVSEAERLIDQLIEMKKEISKTEPQSDERLAMAAEIKAFRDANSDMLTKAAPVFWCRITDSKHRRKIAKRNVMTLPYGATPYGLGHQQIDDAHKHGVDLLLHMDHRWGMYLGRQIYSRCEEILSRPMQLLRVFEEAGSKADKTGEMLGWTVPVTNFPVVQDYMEGIVKRVYVQYGPPLVPTSTGYYENTLQLAICFREEKKPANGRQSRGCAPNVVHSLDAAHLMMVVNACPFPVSTIHDSYGCLLSDMPVLFREARRQFVRLYERNPLDSVIADIGGDLTGVSFGSLDLSEVEESEYCFC